MKDKFLNFVDDAKKLAQSDPKTFAIVGAVVLLVGIVFGKFVA